MSQANLDAITLAVLRAGLINAVAEMKAVVVRTAYSNLWKEAGDLSCGLLTSRGELAVQGIGDIPIHLASMPMSLGACLVRIPPESLKPGDVVYQNDPYQGNNHLPDFIMAKPVFFNDRIVAYTAVRGHYVDVGGGGPGSYSATMPDIYAEGLRIPPVRIFKEGILNQDIVDVLLHNTRNSRERFGDLRSQFAGCVAAERRVISFCEPLQHREIRGRDGTHRRCLRTADAGGDRLHPGWFLHVRGLLRQRCDQRRSDQDRRARHRKGR